MRVSWGHPYLLNSEDGRTDARASERAGGQVDCLWGFMPLAKGVCRSVQGKAIIVG